MRAIPDPVGWWCGLGRPLRRLPRWGAVLVVALTIAACLWSGPATTAYRHGFSTDMHKRE